MSLTLYLSYLVLVLTITYTPGPMTLFCLANGIQLHFKSIWPILFGANNAYLLSILVLAFGLTELLQENIWIVKTIQALGISYLFYLAYKQWNKHQITTNQVLKEIETNENFTTLYKKGFLIALSNPKAILLFSVIFPEFINKEDNHFLQLTILSVTYLLLQFSSGFVYAYFGKKIKPFLDKPETQKLVNQVSAMMLIIVALFLITRW